MSNYKKYTATLDQLEDKLARVMERLGVKKYDYNWSQQRGGGNCYVEMVYKGTAYRFENDAAKSAKCGRGLTYVSDLFAAVVYSLEGLARAVEQDIFTLDMLLAGVPALPAAPALEPCFVDMGFSERPKSADEVEKQYKRMAKAVHPDVPGGSKEAFVALGENYRACMELVRGTGGQADGG